MSESAAHRNLVDITARAIQRRCPRMSVLSDNARAPGDWIPEVVGGHRPDIIARSPPPDVEITIAEAKTPKDIDNSHTRDQIEAFVSHLRSRRRGVGTFVLAVYGRSAVMEAENLLCYELRTQVSPVLRVQLFDGNDFWTLGGPKEQVWCLS